MKRLISLVACALTVALGPVPTSAQERSETFIGPSPVVGAWSFRTAPYRGDICVMSGHMNIRPTDNSEVFSCSFTAVEECVGQDKWVVEQTCKAVSREGRLSIKSTIVNFLESKEFTSSYAPDHFGLTVVSKELMTGALISAVTAPVEFHRTADNVS